MDPFPKISTALASCFDYEMQIWHYFPKSKKEDLQMGEEPMNNDRKIILKRRKNLLEVLNLQKVDETQTPLLTANKTLINIADLKNMAEFLYFKLRTSNIFNIRVSMRNDEEEDFNKL